MKKAPVLVWTADIPTPEGLDSKVFSVAVMVDRLDGKPLSDEDLDAIRAVYPVDEEPAAVVASKPAKASPVPSKKTTKKRSAAKRR